MPDRGKDELAELHGPRPTERLEAVSAVQEMRIVHDAYLAVAELLDSATAEATVNPRGLAALMHVLNTKLEVDLMRAEAAASGTP